MDLSICIPVYNESVDVLVRELLRQARRLSMAFELRVYDDFSEERYRLQNRPLQENDEIVYVELAQNTGRSAIRNLLARESRGEHLLFLDCDMAITKPDFLATYWKERTEGVVYGGHRYQNQEPSPPYRLHWLYGSKREALPFSQRQAQPYASFRSSSFLAHRVVFHEIRFDEQLEQYGHEDTLWAYHLQQESIPLKPIDNTAIHKGLVINTLFIEKTKRSLENLVLLRAHYPPMAERVRILRVLQQIERFKLAGIMASAYAFFRTRWEERFLGPSPSLRILDLYKLGYLCRLVSNTS